MTDAVQVRDLFRIHSTPEGDAAALQGLSLDVRPGEVVVVLGPSGSGKSTFLRILAGLERPSAGAVRVFGADVGRLGGRRLADYRTEVVGYAEQHYSRALAPELSARELVALPLALRGEPIRSRLARADELLERVGLAGRRGARPAELSGGEQQRIVVAAALAPRPRLLLADEPTGELDAANASDVYALIGELARAEHATTVLVTHDAEAASIADRVLQIRDGRLASETAPGTAAGEGIVVGRGGWLRIPEEFLHRAGIVGRAQASVDERGVVIAAADGAAPAVAEPAPPLPAAEAGSVAAELRGVGKTYGAGATAARVLANVTATFAGGRLHAVTGASGSGKTTLLHLVAGLRDPSEGEVVVAGTPLAELGRDARAAFRAEHVALVAQHGGLLPFLSARENVEVALAVRGVARDPARDRALETLAAVGLAERADQRVSRLSAGEQARVALARGLAARPRLLLVDEPTSRLDEASAIAVGVLLARLARETGAAILCATHDPRVIEQADAELPLATTSRARAETVSTSR